MAEYEALAYYRVSSKKNVFIRKRIIITKDDIEIFIANNNRRLQAQSDIRTLSIFKKSKLSLYEIKIVKIL